MTGRTGTSASAWQRVVLVCAIGHHFVRDEPSTIDMLIVEVGSATVHDVQVCVRNRFGGRELTAAILVCSIYVCIVCPFIKEAALEPLLLSRPGDANVFTRFNLAEVADGAGDFEVPRRQC